MAAIEVQNLVRKYGSFTAVDKISFEVKRGEIVGFLGPNGAGKTTTMKVLTGFIAPSDGTVKIDGFDVLESPIEVKNRIGYLPESAPVYRDMTVEAYLEFVGQARGLASAERVAALQRVALKCGLTQRLKQPISDLSKGYRQRVGLAQALIHNPPILVLDEPTSGLDPNQIVEIRNLIREIGQTRTVILSTHILSEVQATCDRVLIINQGQIVADGSTDEISARQAGGRTINVTFAVGTVKLSQHSLIELVKGISGVVRVTPVEVVDDGIGLQIIAERDLRVDLFNLAKDQGLVLLELGREKTSLEDVFQRLTQATS